MTFFTVLIFSFSMKARFLNRILMEHIDSIYSSESKLHFDIISSIRIRARKIVIKKVRTVTKVTPIREIPFE